ncbi:MAG: ParA family protein [Gammaproteobacteria bacterium]|nr:ParA family protein [Gammaproteobacteria bacterium]MBU1655344.1 ParA family protein [Gammaproteobacteria bacterium]MBU1960562.1 ParA family protein [Gammaproteobacteria bacterium]
MRTIMLLNTKGGCGKTTVSTNLCACLAAMGKKVALMDDDPQGSSNSWLARREAKPLSRIQGIFAAGHVPEGVTRSWHLRVEPQTDYLVIDTQAAINRDLLVDYIRRCDIILVPVMPSRIDIHAVAHFIGDLLVAGKIRQLRRPVGIVANRIKQNTRVYRELERFLNRLEIPLVARLRDTQNYIQAADIGCGIHEMIASGIEGDIESWKPLIDWVENVEIDPALESAKPILQNPFHSRGAVRSPKVAL